VSEKTDLIKLFDVQGSDRLDAAGKRLSAALHDVQKELRRANVNERVVIEAGDAAVELCEATTAQIDATRDARREAETADVIRGAKRMLRPFFLRALAASVIVGGLAVGALTFVLDTYVANSEQRGRMNLTCSQPREDGARYCGQWLPGTSFPATAPTQPAEPAPSNRAMESWRSQRDRHYGGLAH